jgi:hypothetical protein
MRAKAAQDSGGRQFGVEGEFRQFGRDSLRPRSWAGAW